MDSSVKIVHKWDEECCQFQVSDQHCSNAAWRQTKCDVVPHSLSDPTLCKGSMQWNEKCMHCIIQEAQDLLSWGADYLVSAWDAGKQSFVAVVGDNTTGARSKHLSCAV